MSYNFNECDFHSKKETKLKLLGKQKKAHFLTLVFSFLHFSKWKKAIYVP